MWKGISLHDEVLKVINQVPRYGKVHSVFNKTINLMDSNGCMISLLTKTMDKCPISILVDTESFQKWRVYAEEDVYLYRDKVVVGSEIIDISRAEKYDLKRGTFNGNYSAVKENLRGLYDLIDSKISKEKYSFDIVAFQMIIDITELLKEACLKEDTKGIIEIGKNLIGLGQGLTPSGDDVLMGLFLVLGLKNSPMEHLDCLLEKIIEGKVEETTDVSYQGLIRASKGFYRSILVETVEGIMSLENIDDMFKDVLSIGHFSGRDLLYGILTGYEILVERRI